MFTCVDVCSTQPLCRGRLYSRHFVASRINAPAVVAVGFTLDHIVTTQTTMGRTKSLLYHGVTRIFIGDGRTLRRCVREAWAHGDSARADCTAASPLGLFCSVLFFIRPRYQGWPHHGRTLHLSLSSVVILTDSSTGSPVHVLMLSIQAVRGLPRLRAPGIVPCIITFSRQLPCFLMV